MSTFDGVSLWKQFCSQLEEAGTVLMRSEAPQDELSQAEGLRYLTRLLRVALEANFEASDPERPRLFQMSNETVKMGGDNPDNIYWNAVISSDNEYIIRGQRGTVPYLSFGTKANRFAVDGGMASTGELEDQVMEFGVDGSFEILVSRHPQPGNWLPMKDDTSMLLVRQTFLDRSAETPATLSIEVVGAAVESAPMSMDEARERLATSARFVATTARSFADWASMFMTRPNEILPWDQSIFQKVGGDPNIHYLHGYWSLQPDQAWVIETEVPECRHWNFVLQNWWMESGDYENRPNMWINKRTGKIDADGKLRIVVAAKDPGWGNWLDTAGHSSGTALLRWISAESHPLPAARVITL